MKSWRACRNIVGKKTKNFRKFQKRRTYNFLNKIVFHIMNVSVAKKILQKTHRFAAHIPKTKEKN